MTLGSMTSDERTNRLDLERDLPTTAEDVAALRRLCLRRPMELEAYFQFLATFPPATSEELAATKGPRGAKSFTLPSFRRKA